MTADQRFLPSIFPFLTSRSIPPQPSTSSTFQEALPPPFLQAQGLGGSDVILGGGVCRGPGPADVDAVPILPRVSSWQQSVGGSKEGRKEEEGEQADREAVRVGEGGGMGQRQGVFEEKGMEDGEERGDNGIDGRVEKEEGQWRQGEEGQDNGKQQGHGDGRIYGEGGGEGKRNGSALEQGKGEREGVMGKLEEQKKALQRQSAEVQSWEEEVIKRVGAVEKREWDVARRAKEIDAMGNVETVVHTETLRAAYSRTPLTRLQHSCTSHPAPLKLPVTLTLTLFLLLSFLTIPPSPPTISQPPSLHPHAFNATAAFLHLPPGSIETPPAAAAAPAAAEPAGSQAAAAAAPKALKPPKQFVREAVAGPLVIAGMVYNRVFDGDYTRFWALHVWQWLEYHRYAGVTRFYWYDEARSDEEDQDVVLAPYIDAGLVVYHRVRELPFVEGNFTAYLERVFRCKQGAAYNHWVQHYASEVHWAFHTDIDEYFFTPCGTPPGFLRHYLQTLPNTTVQVLIQNMFFIGDPLGSDTHTLLERYTLRMPDSSGRHRTKPIAWLPLAAHLMDDCINPHEWAVMENGPPPLVDMEKMRLNHYWGDRAGVISDNTPVYTMDVTMMDEYGDGLVKDESAKPMGVWLRQRMQVAWAVISAQAVHKERERLRKRVAEVKTRVRQLLALVPRLLKGREVGGVKRGGGEEGDGRGGGVKGGGGGEESEEAGKLEGGVSMEVSGLAGDEAMGEGDGDGEGDMMLGGNLMMGEFFLANILNATNATAAANATLGASVVAGANVTLGANVTAGANVTGGAGVAKGAAAEATSGANSREARIASSLPAVAVIGANATSEAPQKSSLPAVTIRGVQSAEKREKKILRLQWLWESPH
ncbi:unnamed protein product [Closterium sp. Naga37s-1]|nr:unnamed protein product [Closterium sp. Naga37s-1]